MITYDARYSGMSKDKRNTRAPKRPETDRHKPRVIIAIPAKLAEVLQPLADRRMRSLAKQVVDILLEYAEKHGLVDSTHPQNK